MKTKQSEISKLQQAIENMVKDHGAKLATVLITFKDGTFVELNASIQRDVDAPPQL